MAIAFVALVKPEHASSKAHQVIGVFTTEEEATRAAYMAEFKRNSKHYRIGDSSKWIKYAELYDLLCSPPTKIDEEFTARWFDARRVVLGIANKVNEMWFYGLVQIEGFETSAEIRQDTHIHRLISKVPRLNCADTLRVLMAENTQTCHEVQEDQGTKRTKSEV
jgi:hypothetical protein